MPDDPPKHQPEVHPVLAKLRLLKQDITDLLARKTKFEALLSATDGLNEPPHLGKT
jgi:hypothetical protein